MADKNQLSFLGADSAMDESSLFFGMSSEPSETDKDVAHEESDILNFHCCPGAAGGGHDEFCEVNQ